ncbi:ABC transporter ATP-binding protein [Natrialba sp. PRR66]|uniref:ABC transporter ATP-binding protein n=1 Tax=Natrialba sp. PRR66 TaxID=3098146 RepID=UPI002B1DA90E|nr:ABC transporter ATP-binding protein [Natrialba sp. PRR66]
MLELTDITKTYTDFAFGPVDLSVEAEVLSVLGPSGSGKTTLLSLIAGIMDADSGSLSLDGRSLEDAPIEERRTGLVLQEGALFPHMTARENIGYAATDPDRIDEFASLLEITDVLDRLPAKLSGGERQRVALARTLAADPDALLLDEPLSSLDAPIRRRLRRDLAGLFASLEIPIVYVTHDQRTATALGDRLAIFRDGSVEQVDSPSAVLKRPATRFVARFTGTENLLEATVVERNENGTIIDIGDRRLLASVAETTDGPVTACIHPSRVQLVQGAAETDGEGWNIFDGTVTDWLNEGAEYRMTVAVDGSSHSLVVTVQPSVFERLEIGSGHAFSMVIPPDAIHLL